MKVAIEITKQAGLQISGHITAGMLRMVLPLLAGALAWPWLIEVARVMGLA